MSDLVSITLKTPHRVLGKSQAEGAQCEIHKGVADDLVKRGIAIYEPANDDRNGEGGE